MVKADLEGLQNLRYILLIIKAATSLKVNWGKSTLSSMGCTSNVGDLVGVLNCEVASLPISYLGLPLGAKSFSMAIWNPVIKRMSRKISGWKGQYLSKGGKVVLLKSALASVPIYFLSLFQAPKLFIN